MNYIVLLAATVAFAPGAPPSKEFMVGIWGEGTECKEPVNFQADGTIKDGPVASWDLQDDKLIFKGASAKLLLKVIDAQTMESQIEGSNEIRTLKRCQR